MANVKNRRAARPECAQEIDDPGNCLRTVAPLARRLPLIERALDVDDDVLAAATDDAWLVERAGGTVRVVPAPRENLKVTTALDLRVAETLLAERA